MPYYLTLTRKILVLLLLGTLLLLFSCSSKVEPAAAGIKEGLPPLYIIKPLDPEPFYFELGANGPALIPSPAEASLNPFIPWTHSRFVFEFLPVVNTNSEGTDREETLYAAINRSGILELKNNAGETAIYYHRGGEIWENFPLAAFFCYTHKPSALLTAERFFSAEEQSYPDSPLWVPENGFCTTLSIPALNNDTLAGWKTNAVFLGKDAIWYIRKNLLGKGNAHFRTIDLSLPVQEISEDVYLEASNPLEADSPSVPPLLAWALAEAERLAGKPCTASVVSSDFPARRLYGSSAAAEGYAANDTLPVELHGYYSPPASGKETTALILFPDGRGVYARSAGAAIRDGHFTLPALPEGFVYTGAALLGENPACLIAAWEEQKDWNVGAAGILLLEIGW